MDIGQMAAPLVYTSGSDELLRGRGDVGSDTEPCFRVQRSN